jgi:hypothetical protein
MVSFYDEHGYDGDSGGEVLRHEVAVWTVGQLRAALVGIADETPVRVSYSEDPGGQFVEEQVVIGADLDEHVWDPGARVYRRARDPREAWFTVSADYPSGTYERPVRS